jgi:hypothetical protein
LQISAHKFLATIHTEYGTIKIPLGLEGMPKNKEKTEIALRLSTCNKYLSRLGKLCDLPIRLTTYVARYSWANVAKSLGYPKDQIAERWDMNMVTKSRESTLITMVVR